MFTLEEQQAYYCRVQSPGENPDLAHVFNHSVRDCDNEMSSLMYEEVLSAMPRFISDQ